MPDGNGLDIMSKLRATGYAPEIIVITGIGDPDEAELAITNGAWDYIEKPASLEAMTISITRALEYRAEKAKAPISEELQRREIIGKSPRLDVSLDLLAQAADSDVNVLITGESGTGKELFANAIHINSSRANKNFVIIDCTALPETLVESVLFGHTRGSFTSAFNSQDGLIKQADKGTLFLDEIGELPLSIQKSFLRVIQEHRFRPVGGKQETSSDFRLVAATNRNLEHMVKHGKFREDLLFRLRTLVIELPPLRECLEDINELTLHYMDKLCKRFQIEPKGFSPEFLQIVTAYKWPGNIRELIQALEKSLLAAKNEPMLFPKHLPTYIRIHVARHSFYMKPLSSKIVKINPHPQENTYPPKNPHPPATLPKLKEIHNAAIHEAEKEYFRDLLLMVNGNINKACQISGLSRSRLYTLLKKYPQPPAAEI
jgi:two-component system NtrC family response regulator